MIATASERNHEFLASLGATPTTYGAGLAQRLATLAPHGIDAALDTAGSGSLPDLVAIVGETPRVATVADPVNAQRLGVRHLYAVNDHALLAEAARLGQEGRYAPRIEQVYPLERIAEAHAHSERGHVRGKIAVHL